jgi:peptide/nickel transport system permease protein
MQRLAFAIFTVWSALTLAFFLLRLLPGDALSAQMDLGGASSAEIAQARADMGLDDPPLAQYIRYMGGVVRGDFGYSLVRLLPASDLIAPRLLPTALLASFAMSLAVLWGISIGIIATMRGFLGVMARGMMSLSLATPLYWTGTLAIIGLSAYIPYSGVDDWRAWLLPISVLAFHGMGGIARVVVANIIAVQSLTFVTVARSKGLRPRTILRRHVLRVALLPVLPVISTQFALLLGGTVITESLFVRTGIGRLLLDSVVAQDYPVVQAIVALSAVIVAGLSLITDFLSTLLDPRLRWINNT